MNPQWVTQWPELTGPQVFTSSLHDGLRGAAGPGHKGSEGQDLKLGSSLRNVPVVAVPQHITRNDTRKLGHSSYGLSTMSQLLPKPLTGAQFSGILPASWEEGSDFPSS